MSYNHSLIFISYRWSHAYLFASHLERSIVNTFENIEVFRDEEKVKKGTNLDDSIFSAIREAQLVLILLHKNWDKVPKKKGSTRLNKLFQEDDWVRRELIEAHKLGKLIIPILYDEADLPKKGDEEELNACLPEALHFLANNILGIKISSQNYKADESSLLEVLETQLGLRKKTIPISSIQRDILQEQGLILPDYNLEKNEVKQPYLGIPYYEAKHAKLFFGRSQEIVDLWDKINRHTSRLLLLYGYSGVGKSSLLRAGLLPRVKMKGWCIIIEKRQENKSLFRLFENLTKNISLSKPTLIVIDQVEEALIEPVEEEELELFIEAVKKTISKFRKLRIILAFRKEYLSEIQEQIKDIDYNDFFLKPLSYNSILEAIRLNKSIRDDYNFSFEEGLEEKIAGSIIERNDQMHVEETSIKAPWLQLLLWNLWQRAESKANFGKLWLNEADFLEVRQASFSKMVKTQLSKLNHEDALHSSFYMQGLTLDIIHYLITNGGTSAIRSDIEIFERYSLNNEDLKSHLRTLENFQLVRRVIGRNDLNYTRLAHDSLAPIIIQLYNTSDAPGIRAIRIIESKKTDIEAHRSIEFSEADIDTIDEGRKGMRKLTSQEEEYIRKNKERIEQRKLKFQSTREQAVELLLDSSQEQIYQLQMEAAAEKLKVAAGFEEKQREVAESLLEIIFFYNEVGNLNEVFELLKLVLELLGKRNLLDTLDILKNKPLQKRNIRSFLKNIDEKSYNLFQERYFPKMIKVNSGQFPMGKLDENETLLLHNVSLSSFKIAQTPITFWQFGLFCWATKRSLESYTSSWGVVGDHPIINVNWFETIAYTNWLSQHIGYAAVYKIKDNREISMSATTDVQWLGLIESQKKNLLPQAEGYRLPTEAEWEYAAKGGENSKSFAYAGSNNIGEVAVFEDNANKRTEAIGSKKPNDLGLYDMSGNIWEWCWDWYHNYYYQNSSRKNPTGPTEGVNKVVRGGGFDSKKIVCQVFYRGDQHPADKTNLHGFRVVQTIID